MDGVLVSMFGSVEDFLGMCYLRWFFLVVSLSWFIVWWDIMDGFIKVGVLRERK